MKITIISTAYPLRGGIAQYTQILYHKLRDRGHQVTVLTFSRQYPGLLFPGKTQLENEPGIAKIDSEPIIDSINPWSWIKAARRVRELEPDLVLFKYWMPFFAPCFGTIIRLVKRHLPARVLFLCDNVLPHEKRFGDVALTKFAFKKVDFFVVQSRAVEKDLLRLLPEADFKFVPHPVYDIFGNEIEKKQARQQLGLTDHRVLLFFGYVRTYKGLELLLQAMPETLNRLKLKLLIVGEFYEDEKRYRDLVHSLAIEGAVQFHSDFISNDEVRKYFSAADVVLLPYTSATQSGIVQLAYHFNKPCIATDVGGLSEVVLDGVTGFIVSPNNVTELSAAIIRFYEQGVEESFSENVKNEKKKYSWTPMIDAIETA